MKYWRTPLEIDRIRIPHGEIHVLAERCKGCRFCVEYCPTDVLDMSSDYNQKGYHVPYAQQPEACIDCKLCELICPDMAIFVVATEAQPPLLAARVRGSEVPT